MRVIFLDIDGVLNSERYFKQRDPEGLSVVDSASSIDPAAVALLNDLLAATDGKIVVSSTWRLGRSVPELEELLVSRGLRAGHVVGKTADLYGQPRGSEIRLWVDTHEVKRFVILDDDSDMEPLMDRLVKTHFLDGLQAAHVQKCIDLLVAP